MTELLSPRRRHASDRPGTPIADAGCGLDRERLQAMFDRALNGILLADDEGRCVDANAALCTLLGYTRDELIGLRLQDVVVSRLPSDTPRQRASDDRRPTDRVMLRRKDGNTLRADLMSSPHVQPGLHMSVLIDASERARAEGDLLDAQRHLRTLAAEQQDRFDEFRAELARDLHDHLGQTLSALKLEADQLEGVAPRAAERILQLVGESLDSVRELSRALRPAALDLGLLPALRSLAVDISRRSDIDVVAELPACLPLLPQQVTLACYRIAQESVSNAMRHARPRNLTLRIDLSADALTLEIRDDGAGFVADDTSLVRHHGLGLLGMRERAERIGATLFVMSAPENGTWIHLHVPLPLPAPPDSQPLPEPLP